jgi:hypothetical protein
MKIKDGTVYASAFGGDFPVCNEEQALAMEAAYADAKANASEKDEGCTCDLIIALLNGKATRGQLFTAGAGIAQDIFLKKMVMTAMVTAMEDAVLKQPVRPGETVH